MTSPDLEAALHLLTDPSLERRTAPHLEGERPDWDALFALESPAPEPLRVLVGTAYELAEARRAVALWQLPAALDRAGLERVIDALLISHGPVRTAPDPRRVPAGARTPEHAAVAHVLGSPRLAARVRPHVHPDGFDWYALIASAQTMSRGQRLLVDIAHDLWTRGDAVGVRELARSLDSANFVRVLEALETCRHAFGASARRPRPGLRRAEPALAA
jgi:hypothetical protein